MADVKTRPTRASVTTFLKGVSDEDQRRDALALLGLMKRITRAQPRMWGPSIVGFGSYHYRYASGREGDWPLTGFSPRRRELTVYIMAGFDRFPDLMARLGRYRTGKSCLYIRRLADVDLAVLRDLVAASVAHMKRREP